MLRPSWNTNVVFLGFLLSIGFFSVPALAQSNPVPLVNQPLVPDSAVPGGQAFTLTVNGTGFVQGSTVNWNNSPLITKFVSSSQLAASVPAENIAKPGTATITVSSPPLGVVSNGVFFSIRAAFASSSFDLSSVPSTSPSWVSATDLNKDGKLDLISVSQEDSMIEVSLGNGNGGFQPPVQYPVCQFPASADVGDFNNDGIPDVAVACIRNSVSILLGNGDGSLQGHKDVPVSSVATSVAAADLNGDGKLDLVVTVNPGQVAILLGEGDGTFQNATNYTAGADISFVVAGDFNADGKIDLAITGLSNGSVSAAIILLGNGDGTFADPVAYPTASTPIGIVAADFNGDGKLDLAVKAFAGGGSGAAISILLGNGDGTFQTRLDYPTQMRSFQISTADLNGDGILDLIVPNSGFNTVATYLGRGDGTFKGPGLFLCGNSPGNLVVGDFDGSGRLGLVTPSAVNTLSILPQVEAVLSNTLLNFGIVEVGQKSPTFQVKFTNIGNGTLTVTSIKLGGSRPGQFAQTNNCSKGIGAGASCTIGVSFRPTLKGQLTATVKITDGATTQPQEIMLKGTGRASTQLVRTGTGK